MCDLESGDVKYSIDASNQRRAALRLALRQGERKLQSELQELSRELYTFLLNTVTRQLLEKGSNHDAESDSRLEESPLADRDCTVPSSSVIAQNVADKFDLEGSGSGLPGLARSTFSIAIKDLFDGLVRQVPDVDSTETWGREALLKRTAKLREANRELEHELHRLRSQHFALSQQYRRMRTFVGKVKATLWLSMNAIVQELEANGASASGVLSVVHRFSSEWPEEAISTQDELLMTIGDVKTSDTTDEAEDGTLSLVEELQHARRVEETKRVSAEQRLAELQASIPVRIQEAVRQATEAARDDSRLFHRLKKEYEQRIDELHDTVETLREEANKRLEDAKRLHDEEFAHVEVVQDELANLRRSTQLMNLQNEKLRNDFVHHKLKSLNEAQQMSRQLRAATEQLATRREEHVVKAEAEKPLLERIAKLTEANEQLGSDLRFVRNRFDGALAERQDLTDDSIRLHKELQLARHDLEGLRSRFSVLETSANRQEEVIAKLKAENSSLAMNAAESRLSIITDSTRAKRVVETLAAKRRSSIEAQSLSQAMQSSMVRPKSSTGSGEGHQQQQLQLLQVEAGPDAALSPFEGSDAPFEGPSAMMTRAAQASSSDAGQPKESKKAPNAAALKPDGNREQFEDRSEKPKKMDGARLSRSAGTLTSGPSSAAQDEQDDNQKDQCEPTRMDNQSKEGKQLSSAVAARPPSGPRRIGSAGNRDMSASTAASAAADDAASNVIRQLASAKINPQRLVQALVQAFSRPPRPFGDDALDFGVHGVAKAPAPSTKIESNRADEGTQTATGFYEVTEAILHEKLLWTNLTKEVVSLKQEYDQLIAAAKSCCLCIDHGGSCVAPSLAAPVDAAVPVDSGRPIPPAGHAQKKSATLRRTVARPLSARPSSGRSACSVPLPHTISVQQLSLLPERFLEKK